jgi:hypothetical protein
VSEVTGDPGQNDALAAEYVLGTLDSEERSQAQALVASDEAFAAKVKLWERRLGELHLMVEPVEPDGKIWERIKAKMPEVPPPAEVKPPEPAVGPEAAESVPSEEKTEAPPELPAAAEAAPAPPPPEPPASADTGWAPRLFGRSPSPAATPAPAPSPPPSPALSPSLSPSPSPSPAPSPPAPAPGAPVLTPGVTRVPSAPRVEERRGAAAAGGPGLWPAFAMLMTLVVVAMAGLVAAWRFVPERLPPLLQPAHVMQLVGINVGSGARPRPPAPPESQFDE